jgi:hypothetical protein
MSSCDYARAKCVFVDGLERIMHSRTLLDNSGKCSSFVLHPFAVHLQASAVAFPDWNLNSKRVKCC